MYVDLYPLRRGVNAAVTPGDVYPTGIRAPPENCRVIFDDDLFFIFKGP
jgi:hypothetical protein